MVTAAPGDRVDGGDRGARAAERAVRIAAHLEAADLAVQEVDREEAAGEALADAEEELDDLDDDELDDDEDVA